MKQLTRQSKPARGGARGGKVNGSEMGSGRGSEERNTAFAANSRRGGRTKDYEIEPVSYYSLLSSFFWRSGGVFGMWWVVAWARERCSFLRFHSS
jgi:hypothetical protein